MSLPVGFFESSVEVEVAFGAAMFEKVLVSEKKLPTPNFSSSLLPSRPLIQSSIVNRKLVENVVIVTFDPLIQSLHSFSFTICSCPASRRLDQRLSSYRSPHLRLAWIGIRPLEIFFVLVHWSCIFVFRSPANSFLHLKPPQPDRSSSSCKV